MKVLRGIATEVGRGLIAGFAGAVAMTIASTLEMKLRKPADELRARRRGRQGAGHPAQGRQGEAALLQPRPLRVRQRLGTRARDDPGGVLRRRAAAARQSPEPLAHFALVWGVGLAMLPALGITKPFWRWGTKEVAIDALHHSVYAAAADGAYRAAGAGVTMPFTQTRWLRAAGMAGITGSRTALGPALAVRRSGRPGWRRASVYLMAALELIGDKLPRSPNRTAPIGLALRIVSGAGVARMMLDGRGRGRAATAGALGLGAAAAILGAFAGLGLRRALTRRLGGGAMANAVAGTIEDAALLLIGSRLASRADAR